MIAATHGPRRAARETPDIVGASIGAFEKAVERAKERAWRGEYQPGEKLLAIRQANGVE